MQISVQKQAWYWGIGLMLFMLALWAVGQAIMPFILGAGIAYILDPVADRLERMGLSRTLSVVAITLTAILVFVAVLLLVVPILIRQGSYLIETAPEMFNRLQAFLTDRFPELIAEDSPVRDALANLGTTISERGGAVLSAVLGSVMGAVSVLALLVIVPVVAFYLLLDWDRMLARFDELLPREHAPVIRRLAGEIDDALGGFLRGEGTVILILAVYYSTTLMLVGLPGGIAVGVLAASLSFIPYVGALIGGVTSIGLALFAFWGEWVWIGAVIGIFVVGQIMEGNFLVPKLVGGHVGLHPIWLLLALSVFGSLFGFVGMIVAVPVAAVLGVIVRYLVERYRESALYTGREVPPRPAPPTLVEIVRRGTSAQTRALAQAEHESLVTEIRIEDHVRHSNEQAAKGQGRTD